MADRVQCNCDLSYGHSMHCPNGLPDPQPAAEPLRVERATTDRWYVWFWNRMGRKGQRCRVVCRGKMNSALLEFEDGYRVVTSRSGLRRLSEDGNSK
jgi:hypothetical protein